MKSLLVHLKDYRKETLLGPLAKLFEALLELLVPLVVAAIIDRGIGGGDRGYILRMSLLLVGLGAVGLAFSVLAQYFAARAAAGFAKKLRHTLFAHIQSLPFSQLDALGTATLSTRLTADTNQVQTGLNLSLRLLLRSPFIVLGAGIMAFTIDKKAALIFAAVIPLLALVVFWLMRRGTPLYQRVQGRLDRVSALTRENLTGVRVLRAFRKEAAEVRGFEQSTGGLARAQRRAGRFSALMNPLTYILINLALIALLQTGAVRVNAGALSQGSLVALYNYLSQILVELIKLASLILTITRSVACAGRIQTLLETGAPLPSPAPAGCAVDSDTAVAFAQVSLRFENAAENALEDISFSVKRGETIGIIGGTGAGKSALINLIPRFYEATTGQVSVFGQDVRAYSLKDLRQKIGLVPQKALLFRGSIRENLCWGKETAADEALLTALEAAQALDVVLQKGGLDALLEQGGKNLSGGQRQRLTIARALVREPEILILDDAASALDYATEAALRKSLEALPFHPTIFIVSQRVSSVRFADRILVLDDGAVAGIGTEAELLQSCAVYREIHASQHREEAEDD